MELEVGFKYREEIVAQKDKLAMEMHVVPEFKGLKFTRDDILASERAIVAALGSRKLGKMQKALRMEIVP